MSTAPPLRKIYASLIVSLDSFIEDARRSLDWFEDGDPAFERYCDEMVDSVDVAIFGRRSYELMAGYWPNAEGAFAKKMNALPKLVLSRTLERATWNNTSIVRDRIGEQLHELKRAPGRSIVVWAGAAAVRSLIELRVLDELRLIVHPIILGGGTPLFAGLARTELRLVRTTQLGEHLAVLFYEPLYG